MIVKCERCQTRFKIPDEKVTEKGVKVRCTKCQNTFRVAREAAPADGGMAPAPAPGGEADPFARFGAASDPQGAEITKPGFFAQGVEASRPPPAGSPPAMPWNSVDGDLDTGAGVFHEPTRVGPIPLPPAARPSANPFDLSAPEAPGGAPAFGGGGAGVGAAGPAMSAPAPVTLFGPPRGGAPASAAPRGAPPAPVAGAARPPPPPAVSHGVAAPSAGGVPPPAPAGAAPVPPRRGAAPAAAPPPLALDGADPFADLLGGPGPAGGAVPPNAFDDLPVPKAPAADALRRAAAPPPASSPTGAMAPGPVRPAQTGARPPAPAAPFQDDDPFASIDIDVGIAPPTAPAPRAAPAPAVPAGEDPFASIDIDDVTVTSMATAAPAFAGEDPFASIGLGGASGPSLPPAAPSSSGPGGRAPTAPLPPFSGAPAGRAPAAPLSPPSSAAAAGAPAGGLPQPSSAPVGRAPAASSQPPPAASLPSPANASDLFDLTSDADPFGEHSGVQPTDTGRAALFGTTPPPADSLDDPFALAPSSGSLLADVPPVDEAQEFSVTLGTLGAPGAGPREVLDLGPAADAPAVSVARPTARPEDVGIPQSRPPSRARKVTALVANLVVASALVVGLGAVGRVYLREGRVDLSVLSPEHLRTLVFPSARPLVAVDVSNALYETRAGRSLFIVRGEAENRTASATRVRVRAALYDGSQRVRSAEALAGALPTPEELYAVGNSDSAAALSQRLDAAATPVAPGARAPFLVMFHEYPADLGAFRLEVTLEPVSSAPAEAGGRKE